jgi:phosphoribosylformylglycinamidine cyclo-ligase
MQDLYSRLGASSAKEEVHQAIKNLDKGIAPGAFCKVLPDILGGNPEMVNAMHADGAGTKSILAYLYWRETGDLSVWKSIAQDSIVMNLDDLLCIGASSNFILTSTIGRNKNLIPGEVIKAIIEGTEEICADLRNLGVPIYFGGGETADVGDLVKTVIVDSNLSVRFPKSQLIDCSNIKAGNVIVGLSSSGKTTYESNCNSGIASNGITLVRHVLLKNDYAKKYPESLDAALLGKGGYEGRFSLLDSFDPDFENLGKALLSPTRTFAPFFAALWKEMSPGEMDGIIHNTGGGHSKVLKFIEGLEVQKEVNWEVPPLFRLIQQEARIDEAELFKTFNCGLRLEMYTDAKKVPLLKQIASALGIDCYEIGEVKAGKNSVTLSQGDQKWRYDPLP